MQVFASVSRSVENRLLSKQDLLESQIFDAKTQHTECLTTLVSGFRISYVPRTGRYPPPSQSTSVISPLCGVSNSPLEHTEPANEKRTGQFYTYQELQVHSGSVTSSLNSCGESSIHLSVYCEAAVESLLKETPSAENRQSSGAV